MLRIASTVMVPFSLIRRHVEHGRFGGCLSGCSHSGIRTVCTEMTCGSLSMALKEFGFVYRERRLPVAPFLRNGYGNAFHRFVARTDVDFARARLIGGVFVCRDSYRIAVGLGMKPACGSDVGGSFPGEVFARDGHGERLRSAALPAEREFGLVYGDAACRRRSRHSGLTDGDADRLRIAVLVRNPQGRRAFCLFGIVGSGDLQGAVSVLYGCEPSRCGFSPRSCPTRRLPQ